MTSTETIIEERVKELNKKIRKAKREWSKLSAKRSKFIEETPTYGNEFDYSSEMNPDDKDILSGIEHQGMERIKQEITYSDEKKYLRSILRRAKDKKFIIYPFSRYGI
jgi:hypothetical protein